MHKKTNTKEKENIFNLTEQYLERLSTTEQQLHTGAGTEWAGKKSYRLKGREELGDGRAEDRQR